MSAVEVDIAEEIPISGQEAPAEEPKQERKRAKAPRQEQEPAQAEPVEIAIEREITKRQIIQSVSTIIVVVLYMVFTLLRDRDSGVVVIDPEDEGWDEG